MRIPIHGEGEIQDRSRTITVTYQANDDGLLLIGGHDDHGQLIQPSTTLSLITGITEYIIEYVRGLAFDITVHRLMKTIGLDIEEKYHQLQNNITCPLLPTPDIHKWDMIPTIDNNPTMKIWLNPYNTIGTGEYWLIPRFTAKQVLEQPTNKYAISMGTGTFTPGPFTMNQLLDELAAPTITIDKNQGHALADTLMMIGNNDEPTNILHEELEPVFPGYHDHTTNRFK